MLFHLSTETEHLISIWSKINKLDFYQNPHLHNSQLKIRLESLLYPAHGISLIILKKHGVWLTLGNSATRRVLQISARHPEEAEFKGRE